MAFQKLAKKTSVLSMIAGGFKRLIQKELMNSFVGKWRSRGWTGPDFAFSKLSGYIVGLPELEGSGLATLFWWRCHTQE